MKFLEAVQKVAVKIGEWLDPPNKKYIQFQEDYLYSAHLLEGIERTKKKGAKTL